ncbi:DUF1566 domain-containing protein [Vibrio proteolyticus]|uniref:Lcl C-terminal domain-containing protein n=1 Tax=Vibrio proteolyticus NBRC 13287 TaxID=1219065 RepID=U3BF86_VIBPR|nr:DUF1566 domain-containing protein [Vibrio proteolyticus]GAD65388.1 hypothetical protein VPR01S_01_01610 [Vibrio proteolyticus NBRC 13287]
MKKLTTSILLSLMPIVGMAGQQCSIDLQKSAPNVRYAFNSNGTIKDKVTGLTWMRCPLGKKWNSTNQRCDGEGTGMFWQAALNEVQSINQSQNHALYHFAGKSEWRMPSVKELMTLAEHACMKPALNSKAFANAFPYSTNEEGYGAGDVRSYVWSNSHIQSTSEIILFDVRNAEVVSYGPTMLEASVLLVSDQ